jgi:hypothetical protein
MERMSIRIALLAAFTICFVAAVAQGQIQPTFFGMGVSQSEDMPKVSYGTLSHPPLAWTTIEGKGRGDFDFSNIDPLVSSAPKNSAGVAQIDLVLGWTPGWAVTSQTNCSKQSDGTVGCTVPPTKMKDWTDFITALVEHYNGSTAPHVQYYEIWNEANTSSFWTGSVASLIALAQAAYPILKQDRYSRVMTPSVVWDTGETFMTQYLKSGGYKYADGLTFHAYPSKTGKGIKLPIPLPESSASTNANLQTMITTFRKVADTNGLSGKPLATTEGGWGIGGVTDPDMQAAWIAQYEIVQAGLAAQNDVEFITWFTWGHSPSGTIESTAGQPTGAGDAYQLVTKWITKQTPAPCTSSGNIWSCAVSSNLIVWDASQTCNKGVCTTSPYTAPKQYEKYIDLSGAISSVRGIIELGVKPILLEP